MEQRALIFKLSPRSEWLEAEAAGRFVGAPVDVEDGYIHFSTAEQVRETAAKHFAGETSLIVAAVDPARLGGDLKWEPSRGGDLFPHLYGELLMDAVVYVADLPLGADGRHVFPGSMR
ncbi:DUF952 domain-containing protein [Aureimonas phyllosphaerae]|uniref:Uncharacterized protein (DUF952 family) n=1 Tax=Aureimonas phyllosphaerae TaxID=1166078 RepID=A0A7W6BN12_9HYPH|nr:DUF952 domain-containing protein [Aureimonas phyllosphaerae]MBB3934896.1 uncharacterized protein (DUF952 family) [Aureimonas phyllosphaerae]MBB3958904.1 uncharacterized protein (DUF952 family) [Aureimonas phyllosphaerae]SFF40888.1 Uncharacterized conserved protein, DUF952 family [Aureimonas phyllosphaerae]